MWTTTTAAVSGPMHVGEIRGIDRHGLRVAVDEAESCARVHGGGRGREEGVGRHHDLAVLHADGAQDDLECGRAGADRDGVPGAVTLGEGLFELAADRSQCELPGDQGVVDSREDREPVFGRKEDPGGRHTHGRRI